MNISFLTEKLPYSQICVTKGGPSYKKRRQSYMVREQHGRMKPPGAEQEIVNRVNKLLNGIQLHSPGKLRAHDCNRFFAYA